MLKKLKIIVIILMMISITPLLIGQEKTNDKELQIWNSLTDEQKWESYKTTHNKYIELKQEKEKLIEEINKEINISKNKDKLIIEYEKLLSKYKKISKKLGISLHVSGGLDEELRASSFTSLYMNIFFLDGKIAISPGIYFKFYDNFGGGVSIGFQINF